MSSSLSSSPPPSTLWRSLPTKPGIYIFKDAFGNILYVGKANRLKHRVRTYFSPPTQLGPKTTALVSQIASLDHIEVASEVEALLLESRLIKKFHPPFNIAGTDDKSPYYIQLTRELFPRPQVTHSSHRALAGPFLTGLMARRLLKQFRRIAPFCSTPRPVRRPCFYSHLGLCSPCPATGDRTGYLKNISILRRLLSGKFAQVVSDLKKDMAAYSKRQSYEAAAQVKTYLDALDFLLHTPVSPDEYLVNPNLAADRRQLALSTLLAELKTYNPQLTTLHRIEFFDISHLHGDSATAAMTVALEGDLNPSHYRHFTIKIAPTNSDPDMMTEILARRLKRTDWPHPDLIVLDGGPPQLSAIAPVTHPGGVPAIALAKREEILYFPDGQHLKLPPDHPGLLMLEHLRDEAHRFSRRLHHKHRAKVIK